MHHHNAFLNKVRTGAWLSLLFTSAVFLAAFPAQSQDKKQTGKSSDDDVIKVTSILVNLDVIVKDKKGKAITDLKPEDFTVFENGVPQKIEFFDSTLINRNEVTQTTATSVSAPPTPRNPNGLPRNIIALVLDGQSTELANLRHVREGIVKYIRERI